MEQRGTVSRAEWRWLIVWIVAALIVTSVPYVIGAARSTPDRVFGGFVIAIEDGYSYLAKMNEGAHGAWTFRLPYTSEPHMPTLIYIHYLLLGKAAALPGVPLAGMYHLARLIFNVLLLLVIYRFVAQFTGSRAVRKLAWLIIAFSGGAGWLLLLTGQPNWLDNAPIDLISPEGFNFLILYAFPHLALARTLLLLGLLAWWSKRRWWLAGLCWLAMGVLVSFYVLVAGAIVLAGLMAEAIAQRRIVWRDVGAAALAGLIAAPMVIYSLVVFTIDPILGVWSAQNRILSPHPLHYVAAYALVGGLAIIGLRQRVKSGIHSPVLIGWLVMTPLLLYVPFNLQRRLIEGWQIPLAIFAASGLVYGVLPAWRQSRLVRRLTQFKRYSVRGLTTWAIAGGLIVSSATYVLLLVEQSARMIGQAPPSFRDGREIAALRWLDGQTRPDDVILSSYATGNFLPTIVYARAFVGHGPETAYSDDKRRLVAEFYAVQTTAAWRQSFLRRWPIDWVFVGPLETQSGAVDLSSMQDVTVVYDQSGYRIYRIKR